MPSGFAGLGASVLGPQAPCQSVLTHYSSQPCSMKPSKPLPCFGESPFIHSTRVTLVNLPVHRSFSWTVGSLQAEVAFYLIN